jgi:EAL domain-containing protein (putative c-di-GMP-specific phosphodiesterase class I)
VAERADQMAPLSQHIAGAAMTGAQGWPEAWRLSLNVTPEDFALPDFAGSLLGRARDAGFAPERLTIEITEQTLIADFAACAQALRQLAGQGVRVALDDFGTGFSNFRTLKALPLDTLKIDRSLVRDVAHDRRDRAILAAMVAMARALSLSVVAEGVETEAQLAVLADEGVDLFQGFCARGRWRVRTWPRWLADICNKTMVCLKSIRHPRLRGNDERSACRNLDARQAALRAARRAMVERPLVSCTSPLRRPCGSPQARLITSLLSGRSLAVPFSRST